MRLRNKETGEVVEFLSLDLVDDGEIEFTYVQASGHENAWSYRSLERFNDEWEDYVPEKPLIKDEKIRKAVRAWAELVPSAQVRYDHSDGRFYTHSDCVQPYSISFPIRLELDEVKNYTVAELCGEEEE